VRAGDVCCYPSGRQEGYIHQQLGKLIRLVEVRATRNNRAWHYEGKRLESAGRKHGNEKGSNGRKGNEMELVHRKRVVEWKVEGLYSGKEQEMFKEEGKQSVKTGGLSNAVRKLMGRGVNWQDEWEEEKGLVVGELGRMIVAE